MIALGLFSTLASVERRTAQEMSTTSSIFHRIVFSAIVFAMPIQGMPATPCGCDGIGQGIAASCCRNASNLTAIGCPARASAPETRSCCSTANGEAKQICCGGKSNCRCESGCPCACGPAGPYLPPQPVDNTTNEELIDDLLLATGGPAKFEPHPWLPLRIDSSATVLLVATDRCIVLCRFTL